MRCIYCRAPARELGTFIGGAICSACLAIIYERPYPVERTVQLHGGRVRELPTDVGSIYIASRLVLEQWTHAGKACALWARYEGAGATRVEALIKLGQRLSAGLDPKSGPDAAQTWVTPLR